MSSGKQLQVGLSDAPIRISRGITIGIEQVIELDVRKAATGYPRG
jgi:hypothetical protein